MKVITIGSATYDAFITYKNPERLQLHTVQGYEHFLLLHEGEKEEIEQISYRAGGGATNSACSFTKLGWDAAPVCVTGKDHAREQIIAELAAAGITTTYIAAVADAPTGLSFILTPPSGNSVVLAYRGANHTLTATALPPSLISTANLLYVTSLGKNSSALLEAILTEAHQAGVTIAWNPGSSQIKREALRLSSILSRIDILILNAHEAQQLMEALSTAQAIPTTKTSTRGASTSRHESLPLLLKQPLGTSDNPFTLPFFFEQMLGYGIGVVLVTNGDEGVYVATKEVAYFHPSIPVKVVSTVGAGDAFGSCFVATFATTQSLETALRYAALNSSSVVGKLDAKEGLLTLNELHEQAKSIPTSLLRPIDL